MLFDKDTKCGMDYRDLKGKYAILPNSYIYTCEKIISKKSKNNIYSEPDNSLYLHSFCVASISETEESANSYLFGL